jgi:glutathione S-transferase
MLEEVGAPYETEVVEYGSTMKAEPYLSINPMGKVPAIKHKGKVVTEVAAICCYLADAFPEAKLAPPPSDRADYYRWIFFTSGPVEAAFSNKAAGWEPTPERQRMFGYGNYDLAINTFEKGDRGQGVYCGGLFHRRRFVRWRERQFHAGVQPARTARGVRRLCPTHDGPARL